MNSKERRALMLERIKKFGWLGFNRSEFAREVGVSAELANKDYHKIMKEIPRNDILELKSGLYRTYERSVEELLKIINDKSTKMSERLQAMSVLNQTKRDWLEFLESFELKEKISEEVKISFIDPYHDDTLSSK
jgi:hypothetical protein